MLLKVEVYSFTGEAFSGAVREPDETLHVCLATSQDSPGNDDDNGRLLTVGRKTGNVVLGKDKSVSREHMIIRMVTTNKTLPGGSKMAPLPARTPEEQKACQESSFYQCSAVLESVGKLGTYIVEEAPAVAHAINDNKNGDDSDTDDEGDAMISQSGVFASQASQLPLSSWIRTLVLGDNANDNSRHIQSRLINQSTILTPLDSGNGRVVVLCGKQESILVLTRIPLFIQRTKTAFDKSNVPSWWSEIYAAGAVDLSETVPPGTMLMAQTTHVISGSRKNVPSRLSHFSSYMRIKLTLTGAWLKSLPIVKADYFRALLERKSPVDPLPDSTEYEAPYPLKASFWRGTPIAKVWNGLTYVSMKSGDDWPDVVEAMGGTVFRLYHESSQHPDSNSDDDDEEDEEQISQQRLAAFDPLCTWSVDWKVRRYVKPLKDAKIPIFSAKEVAKAVANSQVLPGLTPMPTSVPKTPAPMETQSSKTHQAARVRLSAGTLHSSEASMKSSPDCFSEKNAFNPVKEESPKFDPSLQLETKPGTVKEEAKKSEDELEPNRPRAKPSRSKPHLQDSDDEEREPKSKKARMKISAKHSDSDDSDSNRIVGRGSRSANRFRKEDGEAEKGSKTSRRKKEPEPTKVEKEDPSIVKESKSDKVPEKDESTDGKVASETETNKRQSSANDEDEAIERQVKRVKLGNSTNAGGWLQAAPSDPKKRMTHARTKDEIVEAYGGDSHDLNTKPAITEWAPKPKNKVSSAVAAQSRRRREYTGPNFKAFRKNRVPALRIVDYQWKSHRSGPAVQQAHLEEEQRAADEQFRRANELFNDVTTSSSNRRRKLR
eukprot:scaffold1170_cov174-Amphora_coffeaeformis.AAC.25